MSTAPAEVTPPSEPASERPEPEFEPSPVAKSPSKRWRWIILAAAVLIVGGFFGLMRTRDIPSRPASVTQAHLQNPEHGLRLKGTTEAVQARAILAPLLSGQQIGTLTIVHLALNGAKVKQGDLLVEFDRQAQMRDIIDKQAEYQKLVDQVAVEQAKEAAARAKDETELKTAEDDLRKAKLEVQKEEIVSRIDAEKNQETLQESQATYDQLRETFDLKRKAAEAAIRSLEIQRDRTRQTMEHAKANSDQMQIRSPLDGVVVLNTIWKQGTMGEVQEGDQVRPGVPFMQVVNPAIMQVRVLANQQDFPSLRVGQSARIRLDAYPEMVLGGKIDQISPIGEGGDFSSKLRTFAVIVAIQGNDPKLMPDLSAAVDVDLDTQKAAATSASAGSGSL
ncbi:MAG TPA: efflux RND transporter periplasmic adaptor subunit [Candidatus Sulfotelmatobacter sp.]|nr:efflux RND transporter periplasmic adaptor subunit [Candidatus Sulfotelmatobacter sp.]